MDRAPSSTWWHSHSWLGAEDTVTLDADSVSVPISVYTPSTVYTRTGFHEVTTESADIRLLRCALRRSASRRTNKEESKQCSNKK